MQDFIILGDCPADARMEKGPKCQRGLNPSVHLSSVRERSYGKRKNGPPRKQSLD